MFVWSDPVVSELLLVGCWALVPIQRDSLVSSVPAHLTDNTSYLLVIKKLFVNSFFNLLVSWYIPSSNVNHSIILCIHVSFMEKAQSLIGDREKIDPT